MKCFLNWSRVLLPYPEDLDVQYVLCPLLRTHIEIGVVLKGNADQITHRVLTRLGKVFVTLSVAITRTERKKEHDQKHDASFLMRIRDFHLFVRIRMIAHVRLIGG